MPRAHAALTIERYSGSLRVRGHAPRARRTTQRNPMLLAVLIAIPLLLIWVLTLVDLFRRHDLSTGRKVMWAVVVLILPVVGVIIYFWARPPQPIRRRHGPA